MQLLPHSGRQIARFVWLIACLGLFTPGVRAAAPSQELQGLTSKLQWTSSERPHDGQIGSAAKQVYRVLVELDGSIKSGTAFLVSGTRVVATNDHVLKDGKAYLLGFLGDKDQVRWVRAHILAVFPEKDLALLQAQEDLPGQPFPLAGDFPKVASDLYAIGFPAAADPGASLDTLGAGDPNILIPSVTTGSVSRIMAGASLTYQLQHQTPISAGYSGGPLLDGDGVVVGVSSAIHKEANGIAYGVAAQDLTRLLSACSLSKRIAQAPPTFSFEALGQINGGSPKQQASSSEDAIIRRGYAMLRRGDVAQARSVFEYLANLNHSREAYAALGRSYDPQVLKLLPVFGEHLADASKAQEYYSRAQRTDAATGAFACNNAVCRMQQEQGGGLTVQCSGVPSSVSALR